MAPSTTVSEAVPRGVCSVYRDGEVLLTGATGFLGKVLLEKLLRSCPDINTLYLIVRSKKGLHPEQRIRNIFNSPLFSKLEGKWESKVVVLSGDLGKEGLGLAEEDQAQLLSRVTVVFHAAATVRFDEPLDTAAATNVAATKNVLEMALKMPNLKAMVHVSTAYSNCPRSLVEEKVYPPPMPYNSLLKVTQSLDSNLLHSITPQLIGDWPNTYVYTKQIAEDLVSTMGKDLPVAIFRPSIVVCTAQEPVSGWTDSVYGTTGAMVGTGTGIMRTLLCDSRKVANIVPVDMVANAIITTAARTANRNKDGEKEVLVYNYVSSVDNPITWGEFMDHAISFARQNPPLRTMWYMSMALHSSRTLFHFKVLLLHFLPALLMDALGGMVGKSPNMVKLQKKIYHFANVLSYFCMRNWDFKNDNVHALWEELDQHDRTLFPLDLSTINWSNLLEKYVDGVKLYIMGDDISKRGKALFRMRIFSVLHHLLMAVVWYLTARTIWVIAVPLIMYIIT